MQIVPSILVSNPQELSSQISRLLPFYQRFQVDIADGVFVPNKTISLIDALSTIEQFSNITIDFHLMVQDYNQHIDSIQNSSLSQNVQTVFVHFKSNPSKALFSTWHSSFVIGIAINPDEDIETIKRQLSLTMLQAIQLMSVSPGAQGQPFIPEVLNKIEQLRLADYRNSIFLDGGINEKTLPLILSKKYQPDYICPGSYFSLAENVQERVQSLEKTLREKKTK